MDCGFRDGVGRGEGKGRHVGAGLRTCKPTINSPTISASERENVLTARPAPSPVVWRRVSMGCVCSSSPFCRASPFASPPCPALPSPLLPSPLLKTTRPPMKG